MFCIDSLSRALPLTLLCACLCSGNATADQIGSPGTYRLPSSEWHQISIPGTPPASAAAMRDVLADDVGSAVYGTDWIVFAFNRTTNSYRAISLDEVMQPGVGYWVQQLTGSDIVFDMPAGTVSPQGIDGLGVDEQRYVPVAIADQPVNGSLTAWAMVGAPDTQPTDAEDLRVLTNAQAACVAGSPCSLTESLSQQLTDSQLYRYSDSAGRYLVFDESDSLPNWTAYWLGSVTESTVMLDRQLLFPVSTSSPPGPSVFSDEFNTNSLNQWLLLHQIENRAPLHTLLDVNTSTAGALTIEPTRTPGWFNNGVAPLIFQEVTGNFSIETSVTTLSTANAGSAPTRNFNSAGVMARDPAGAAGPENHIMVNVGYQRGFAGSETKTTVNSNSNLELDAGPASGRVLLCRIGNEFRTWRQLAGDTGWQALRTFTRNDLPDTLQVGLVANAYTGPDLRAEFEYARLGQPTAVSGCLP